MSNNRTISDRGLVRSKESSRGFTLPELLVVIGIIVVLLALMVPVLSNAREWSRYAVCSGHQRQLVMGFMCFAANNSGNLPGVGDWSIWSNASDAYKRDWLIGYAYGWTGGPQNGTIFPYVNSNYAVYLCPSYFVASPINCGYGSNGRFDYSVFSAYAGAKISLVSPMARFHYSNHYVTSDITTDTTNIGSCKFDYNVLAPLICEEDPQGGINGGNPEGDHNTSDRLGHNHFGGANYAAVDGSIHFYIEPQNLDGSNASVWNWEAMAPNGKWKTLGYEFYIPTGVPPLGVTRDWDRWNNPTQW